MSNLMLIAGLLDRMNQNQLALGVTLKELSGHVEQLSPRPLSGNVRRTLETLDKNLFFIRSAISDLVTAHALDDVLHESKSDSSKV